MEEVDRKEKLLLSPAKRHELSIKVGVCEQAARFRRFEGLILLRKSVLSRGSGSVIVSMSHTSDIYSGPLNTSEQACLAVLVQVF